MMEDVNSTMIYLIYCKNFCKCHNEPPTSTKKRKKTCKAKAKLFNKCKCDGNDLTEKITSQITQTKFLNPDKENFWTK
jgi:hypothetical protein